MSLCWLTLITNDLTLSLVDASQAGEGNLEILVTAGPGNNIPTRVEPLGGARFNVTFSPRTADTHSVVVTFNDEPVRGTKDNRDTSNTLTSAGIIISGVWDT